MAKSRKVDVILAALGPAVSASKAMVKLTFIDEDTEKKTDLVGWLVEISPSYIEMSLNLSDCMMLIYRDRVTRVQQLVVR